MFYHFSLFYFALNASFSVLRVQTRLPFKLRVSERSPANSGHAPLIRAQTTRVGKVRAPDTWLRRVARPRVVPEFAAPRPSAAYSAPSVRDAALDPLVTFLIDHFTVRPVPSALGLSSCSPAPCTHK